MEDKKKKFFVECECGARVYGKNEPHAKSLLPAHKRSKRHEDLMEIKKRKEREK